VKSGMLVTFFIGGRILPYARNRKSQYANLPFSLYAIGTELLCTHLWL